MPSVELRKRVTLVEEIFHEGGPVAKTPYRRAAILAVIKNPFAGRYVEEIVGFSDDLKPLGLDMAKALIAALGGDPKAIQGYGKGAIVGAAGEIEHGALWHAPGGYAMREALGGAMAIVPSAKKVAGPGARLDVPITHINASYVRSHFDAIEVGVADAPRADEMLLALAMTTGPARAQSRRRARGVPDQGSGRAEMKAKIRKLVTVVEETRVEMDRAVEPPTRRAAAVAVIENPFAGRYVEDLSPLIDIGEELGELLGERARRGARHRGTERARATARRRPSARTASSNTPPRSCIRSSARRCARSLGKGAALIPSSKKRGGPGVALDVPLGHKDAAFVRSHFDGMEVRIADAPRANEIVVAVAVTDSGRPHPRVGGLTKDEIKGVDGLR